MARVPPGFEFHEGVDGLIVGLSIVFLVKLHTVFSSLINWWRVPEWTYKPVTGVSSGIGTQVASVVEFVSTYVRVGGGGSSVSIADTLIDPVLSGTIMLVGLPVWLTGSLSANLAEQLLVIVGFWIAVVVPFWAWAGRPLYLWWQNLDLL